MHEAVQKTINLLTELPKRDDFNQIIEETFGNAGTEKVFENKVEETTKSIASQGLGLTIEFRKSSDLNGAQAAYTSKGQTAQSEFTSMRTGSSKM